MGMREKLLAAAQAAATEATTNERARCLWCADEVVRELREKISKKFLLSAAHEHAAKAKLQIAEAVVRELRRAIVSGVRPVSETGQKPDAADLSIKCIHCGLVSDRGLRVCDSCARRVDDG